MTDRWTTEDVARELELVPPGTSSKLARTAARDCIRRWRGKGYVFDVEIDPQTSERRYLPSEIGAARAADRQGYRTDLKRERRGEAT